MPASTRLLAALTASTLLIGTMASAQVACNIAGPQTPRDITSMAGTNATVFPFAPASTAMNLCNIHTHTNAEHKGPGFSVFVGPGEDGGYQCNETADLTEAELAPGEHGEHGVKPGETIEVHWVHSSCNVEPGESLKSCLSDTCENPVLRVETQVFLVVNDEAALDFNQFMYDEGAGKTGDFHQPRALPTGTGDPAVFLGSTTGPSYDSDQKCSPASVTWSVRPQCAKVNVATVNGWLASDNVFKEKHSHGVRELVIDPALLSQIGG